MKVYSRWIVAVAIVAFVTPMVQAQRGQRGPGGGPMFLLGQKSVQEELKLSEDQVGKITQLADKQQKARGELQDLSREERQKKMQEQNQAAEKEVAEILKPEQLKRLKQITLQQRGVQAVAQPEVAEALGLSSEQKEKLKTIQADAQKEMREIRQSLQGGGGNREEAQKKMAELRKAAEEKVADVLTADQKAKWKEMLGEHFKGEIARPGPRGGNRQGGGAPPR
jgi:hypothetical protein